MYIRSALAYNKKGGCFFFNLRWILDSESLVHVTLFLPSRNFSGLSEVMRLLSCVYVTAIETIYLMGGPYLAVLLCESTLAKRFRKNALQHTLNITHTQT